MSALIYVCSKKGARKKKGPSPPYRVEVLQVWDKEKRFRWRRCREKFLKSNRISTLASHPKSFTVRK
jgi:hypothetical protein